MMPGSFHFGISIRSSVPGFEAAGADGVFHSASVRIIATDTVELTSSSAEEVQSIRYAFHAWVEPPTTLENSGGLPAEPFHFPSHPTSN